MPGVLALSPLALVIVLLAVRVPTWISAAAGLLGSVVCALLAFPAPLAVFAVAGADYFPLVVEVALILLFGMMLAAILEASGAMRALSGWVEATVPSRSIGVALVVFGIVPFAESVTGFGIGVTIGVPVLRHLGCSIRHSALFGLLGLVAVPWGALGPGTTVAAALADLDVDALGLTTAWINAIPIAVVLVAIIVLARPKPLSALGMATAAGLLWAGILASNALLGMAPAGIVGSLLVIAGIGLPLSIRSRFAGMDRRLGRAVLPYATLTVGILLARELYALVPSPLTDIVSSPPSGSRSPASSPSSSPGAGGERAGRAPGRRTMRDRTTRPKRLGLPDRRTPRPAKRRTQATPAPTLTQPPPRRRNPCARSRRPRSAHGSPSGRRRRRSWSWAG